MTLCSGCSFTDVLEGRRLLSGVGATQASYSVGLTPSQVVAADFNGDRRTDLAVLGAGGGGVSVLLGLRDGTFGAARAVRMGFVRRIATGDFNRDRRADLAVIDSSDHVTIHNGKSDGTFGVLQTISVRGAGDLAVGDFNADGRDDLAVGTVIGNGNGLSVIFNRSGRLVGARRAVGGSEGAGWINQMFTTDVNGDGRDDVTAIDDVGGVHVYLARKGDRFAAATNQWFGRRASGFALADLDGDHHADLIVGGWGLTAADPESIGEIDILKGNGDGTFAPVVGRAAPGYGGALAATDVNRDNTADLVLVTATAPEQIWFNDSKGEFIGHQDLQPGDAMHGAYSSAIFLADLNGDGASDLLQLNSDTESVVATTLS